MHAAIKGAMALAVAVVAGHAAAQVTFYENDNFQGRNFSTERQIGNFERFGFNDRASSVVVSSERWEVCDDFRFRGRCVVLRPGSYPSLQMMGLNDRVSSARIVDPNIRVDDDRYAPAPGGAEVIFYENENFAGRSFAAESQIEDFRRYGLNDQASSAVVMGERWEVCSEVRFGGNCVVLRQGSYPSLVALGLNDRLSSVRMLPRRQRVEDNHYVAPVAAVYDNRRRNEERLFQADVTSVRAVLGPNEQRCWVEQEQVSQGGSSSNAGGAIAGALIGGILGHQVGGGSGKDLATAGGAVAGAVIGSRVGGGSQAVQMQNVQRCASMPSQAAPAYWDVTYIFRGQEHRIQMTTPPGPNITVNEQGEPRA